MAGELIRVNPRPKLGVLTEEQKQQVIELLYEGHTLLEACERLAVKRGDVAQCQREVPEFDVAVQHGLKASGDVQAERISGMLRTLGQAFREKKIDATACRVSLAIVKEMAAHHRWMADRSSGTYQRRKPAEAEEEKLTKFEIGVPEKDPHEDPDLAPSSDEVHRVQ